MSVEDDAKEWAAAWEMVGAGESGGGILHSAAVGELWVVGEDGADASEDGVAGVAKELHFVAGSRAGEPVRLVGVA